MVLLPTNLKNINKRIKIVKITYKIYMINIRAPYILREVKVLVTKYYRHPYIYRSNSTDKETHRVKIGTMMNKHEILAITGCA